MKTHINSRNYYILLKCRQCSYRKVKGESYKKSSTFTDRAATQTASLSRMRLNNTKRGLFVVIACRSAKGFHVQATDELMLRPQMRSGHAAPLPY